MNLFWEIRIWEAVFIFQFVLIYLTDITFGEIQSPERCWQEIVYDSASDLSSGKIPALKIFGNSINNVALRSYIFILYRGPIHVISESILHAQLVYVLSSSKNCQSPNTCKAFSPWVIISPNWEMLKCLAPSSLVQINSVMCHSPKIDSSSPPPPKAAREQS